jgi:hypothetical protein
LPKRAKRSSVVVPSRRSYGQLADDHAASTASESDSDGTALLSAASDHLESEDSYSDVIALQAAVMPKPVEETEEGSSETFFPAEPEVESELPPVPPAEDVVDVPSRGWPISHDLELATVVSAYLPEYTDDFQPALKNEAADLFALRVCMNSDSTTKLVCVAGSGHARHIFKFAATFPDYKFHCWDPVAWPVWGDCQLSNLKYFRSVYVPCEEPHFLLSDCCDEEGSLVANRTAYNEHTVCAWLKLFKGQQMPTGTTFKLPFARGEGEMRHFCYHPAKCAVSDIGEIFNFAPELLDGQFNFVHRGKSCKWFAERITWAPGVRGFRKIKEISFTANDLAPQDYAGLVEALTYSDPKRTIDDINSEWTASFHSEKAFEVCRTGAVESAEDHARAAKFPEHWDSYVSRLESLEYSATNTVLPNCLLLQGVTGAGKSFAATLGVIRAFDEKFWEAVCAKLNLLAVSESKKTVEALHQALYLEVPKRHCDRGLARTHELAGREFNFTGCAVLVDETFRMGGCKVPLLFALAGTAASVVFTGERRQCGAVPVYSDDRPVYLELQICGKVRGVHMKTSFTLCKHLAVVSAEACKSDVYGAGDCGTQVMVTTGRSCDAHPDSYRIGITQESGKGLGWANVVGAPGTQGDRADNLLIVTPTWSPGLPLAEVIDNEMVHVHLYTAWGRIRCGSSSLLHFHVIDFSRSASPFSPTLHAYTNSKDSFCDFVEKRLANPPPPKALVPIEWEQDGDRFIPGVKILAKIAELPGEQLKSFTNKSLEAIATKGLSRHERNAYRKLNAKTVNGRRVGLEGREVMRHTTVEYRDGKIRATETRPVFDKHTVATDTVRWVTSKKSTAVMGLDEFAFSGDTVARVQSAAAVLRYDGGKLPRGVYSNFVSKAFLEQNSTQDPSEMQYCTDPELLTKLRDLVKDLEDRRIRVDYRPDLLKAGSLMRTRYTLTEVFTGREEAAGDDLWAMYTSLSRLASKNYMSRRLEEELDPEHIFSNEQLELIGHDCVDTAFPNDPEPMDIVCVVASLVLVIAAKNALGKDSEDTDKWIASATEEGRVGEIIDSELEQVNDRGYDKLDTEAIGITDYYHVAKTQHKMKAFVSGGQPVMASRRERILRLAERVRARLIPIAFIRCAAAQDWDAFLTASTGHSLVTGLTGFIKASKDAVSFIEIDEKEKDGSYSPVPVASTARIVAKVFGVSVGDELYKDLMAAVAAGRIKCRKSGTRYILYWKLKSGEWVTLDLNTSAIPIDLVLGWFNDYRNCDSKDGGFEHIGKGVYRKRLRLWGQTIRALVLQGDDVVGALKKHMPERPDTLFHKCVIDFKPNLVAADEVIDYCHVLFWAQGPNAGCMAYDPHRLCLKAYGRYFTAQQIRSGIHLDYQKSLQYITSGWRDPLAMSIVSSAAAMRYGNGQEYWSFQVGNLLALAGLSAEEYTKRLQKRLFLSGHSKRF